MPMTKIRGKFGANAAPLDRFSNETHDGQGEASTKMDIALFDVVAPPGNLTLRPKAPVLILELGNYCGSVKVGTISMAMNGWCCSQSDNYLA